MSNITNINDNFNLPRRLNNNKGGLSNSKQQGILGQQQLNQNQQIVTASQSGVTNRALSILNNIQAGNFSNDIFNSSVNVTPNQGNPNTGSISGGVWSQNLIGQQGFNQSQIMLAPGRGPVTHIDMTNGLRTSGIAARILP